MAFMIHDPFDTLLQFQHALDALRTSSWLETGPSGGGAFPPLNAFSKGDDVVIIAEVPGIPKSALQIQVKGSTLRISGTKQPRYSEGASVHRSESVAGSFDRAITLPVEIDAARVRAECRDGILAIYLPRAEHDKPRSIAVG